MAVRYNHPLLLSLAGILLFLAPPAAALKHVPHKEGAGNLMVETKLYYGFIYAHRTELDKFKSGFPAMEISIQKATTGKHAWERIYNYPVIGVAFFYSGLGKSQDLGRVYALMPFITFPLARYHDFTAGFRLAVGAAYLPNPYDSINNRLNTAIGTNINAAINLMFEIQCRLSSHLILNGGISFQHFSNGGWKMPNYGLNVPLANIGIAYLPFNKNTGKKELYPINEYPIPPMIKHRIVIHSGAAIAFKNRMVTLGENFLIYHIYENTFFPVSRKSMFGFGFDLSYDPSFIRELEIEGRKVERRINYCMPGINAAYALVISRLEIIMNLGYYPGRIKPDGSVYEKLAIQYNFTSHFFGQLMLKAHSTSAAYVACGIGYSFNIRYGKKGGGAWKKNQEFAHRIN